MVRYLGTCFNPSTREAYVVSDYVAGCTLLEIQRTAQIRSRQVIFFLLNEESSSSPLSRELLELSEEDKLQAAMDVAEAVYFIHNLSNPVVHQVSLRNHKKSLDL